MLIVGGAAALTVITAYLTWHFVRQWRIAVKRRSIERPAFGDNRRPVSRAHGSGQLNPVR